MRTVSTRSRGRPHLWLALAVAATGLVALAPASSASAAPAAAPEAAPMAGPCDDDIDFGERISCNFNSPTTIRDLGFTAAAGDQIRVRVVVTGGSVNPVASLRRGDTVVCGPTFSDEFTCPIATGGAHVLRVDANGSGTGTASMTIQRLNDPVGCKSISENPTGKTDKINNDVEIDCFEYVASTGTRLRTRVVETGGAANLVQEIIRPDGTTVCNGGGTTDLTCVLDATGEFRVLVRDDNGLDTGNYRLVLQKFPDPSGCINQKAGTAKTYKINDAGEVGCSRIAANAGGNLRVRVVSSAGSWNPLVDLVAPDGTLVCGPSFSDEFTCPTAVAGTYTVIARDGSGTGQALGEGRVFLQTLDDPASCPTLKPGTKGKTSALATGVAIDCFTLKGNSGNRLRTRVVETGGTANLVQEIVRPDGTTVCNGGGTTDLTCLLDASGKSRLLVQDDNGLDSGNYRVVLEKFPKPKGCPTLDAGDSTDVEVGAPGAIACVQTNGTAGDQLRVRVVSTGGGWNPLVDVVSKDGTTVCGPSFSDEFTCALTSNGKHAVIIRDGSGQGAATGTAAVFVQNLTDPTGCASLAYGVEGKTGQIGDAVELDCFSRDATAGQRWWVRVVETSGAANLVTEVVRPNGTTVCNGGGGTDLNCLLDQNGEFRVVVQDDNGLETGAYRVVLQRFPNPAGCHEATVGGADTDGAVSVAGGIDCVTFSGKAGDVVAFSVVSTGGTWNPLAEVLRADGSLLCGPTFSDVFSCTLTTNGKHTVIVRDGAGAGSSTGTYTLGLDEG